MILRSLRYSQHEETPNEWIIDNFNLGQINLIVGRNATGKTRTLNVIAGLANLISGDQKLVFTSGDYDVTFHDNADVIEYHLRFEDAKILSEKYILNNSVLLDRGIGGKGTIRAYQLNMDMEFQTPENELACVTRRDTVQHPFFEGLYQWGKSLRHYLFGTQLGKDHLAVFVKGKDEGEDINPKDANKVVGFFKRGVKRYGDVFVNSIKKGMESIGYRCDDIGVSQISGLISPIQGVEGLYVKEADLQIRTFQHEMSQGMFRALSLFTQLVFSRMEGMPSCVLVDDIGEGLDYERSSLLINYLIGECKDTSIQLIMSTNDKFVMNSVPLEYWSVIQRHGVRCRIFNYDNSKEIFDEFKFTGLVNFDFLATDFYLKGFNEK